MAASLPERATSTLVARSMRLEQLAEYTYTPLPNDKLIRLLEFAKQPVQFPDGSKGRPIILSLHSIDDVGNKPDYETLSYTWGFPVDTPCARREYKTSKEWLILEGGIYRRIRVRTNLYEALRRLPSFAGKQYLWIDALCINQSDMDERASQVKRMGAIYSSCVAVLIWLGDVQTEYKTSDDFAEVHDQMLPALERAYEVHTKEAVSYLPLSVDDMGRLELKGSLAWSHWISYTNFYFRRTWFRRSWVYQEYCFAPQARFIFDNHTCDAWSLFEVADILSRSFLGLEIANVVVPDLNNERMPWLQMQRLRLMKERYQNANAVALREKPNPETRRRTAMLLADNLCVLRRYTAATDPRDKVYSLMGFLPCSGTSGPMDQLLVSYQLSIAQVYTLVAVNLLSENIGLNYLAEVEHRAAKTRPELPSWVPDLDMYTGSVNLGDSSICTLDSRFSRIYNASRPTGAEGRCLETEGPVLVLTGRRVDAVRRTYTGQGQPQMPFQPEGLGQNVEFWLEAWSDIMESSDLWLQCAGPWEALRRAIWAGTTTEDAYDASSLSVKAYAACKTLCEDFPEQSQDAFDKVMSNGSKVYAKWEQHLTVAQYARTEYEWKLLLLVCIATSLRLFRSTNGRIGKGSTDLRVGDEIWLIKGATVPYALRKDPGDETFTLVGAVFIDGMMEGEMWPEVCDQLERVRLR